MKRLLYLGTILLVLFEIANVYFIMPLPYSQRLRSIDLAYFLYKWRWAFRVGCAAMIAAGIGPAWRRPGRLSKGLVPLALVVAAGVAYVTNAKMAADKIFLAPAAVTMRPAAQNVVEPQRLVVGIEINGDARAYPIRFIGYHHQVRDSVGGKPVMVSFCTVCRTGRVFDPVVNGRVETFRLVGMDHFNAMFEDRATGSWWRQATGEAIAGPKRGTTLRTIPSQQVTLARWLELYPRSLIMQPDSALAGKYTKSFDYETGASRGALTGTDPTSWRDKAWVVGLSLNGASRAYDWNRLRRERIVNDTLGGRPIVLALASDSVSFFAFQRPDSTTFSLARDSLVGGGHAYGLSGRGPQGGLTPLAASQEFWHSWRTFHPGTTHY